MRLFFLLTLILGSAAHAEMACEGLFAGALKPAIGLVHAFQIERYSYLAVDGAPSLKSNRLIFVRSRLSWNKGNLIWQHFPSFEQTEVAYGPFSHSEAALGEGQAFYELVPNGVRVNATPLLEFVYRTFADQLTNGRVVFDPEFVESLRFEDRMRNETEFAVWSAKNFGGDLAAVWAVYDHSPFSLTKRLEITRVAKGHQVSGFALRDLLPFVSELMRARGWIGGVIEMKTDSIGARYYARLGATVLSEYEPGKFKLEIQISTFLRLYAPPDIKNGARPLQVITFMDEPYLI